ncbi:BglG family transcription antiterminator [Thermoactinomyces mirandus]|uniref:Transcription antiterminator n=1 Tax=Thermoactinomyces mirandus TaxID=2756294 RepID=A0A7W2ARQ3_9BACL|nr:BglG family transcription antiterminator [Thermoactinomyces mirandus]MBA4603244.1 transcription antiterminator [Thermoactinomyces mirandus]
MLNQRMQHILRELMSAHGPITGTYLANLNQVTVRTIREDVKHLDALLAGHGARIESLMGKGYQLIIDDDHGFRQFLNTNFGNGGQKIPGTPEERISHMIRRLLLNNGYLKLENLADEMYVSKSTVQNDLKQVKEQLGKYDIKLVSRPNHGLKVEGREIKLRFCMAEYIFSKNDSGEIRGEPVLPLPRRDLDRIHQIILNQIKKHQITMADISVNNLLIHIAIALKRIKNGNHVTLHQTEIRDILRQKEYIVANHIAKEIGSVFQTTFPKEEIAYIAIHLAGTKMLSQTYDQDQLVEHVVDQEILRLVYIMLEKIEEKMELDLKHDRELIMGLGLHLKPAINRYKFGMNIRNPMLEDIKKNYPLAFDAGVIAGMAIEDKTGIRMNENEIGYLALHFGVAMERKKSPAAPKRCLIVCASGLGTAQLIYYKIKNRFGKNLDVAGTTEYYNLHQCNLRNIDFIVSSIPIFEPLPVPVIEVNAIMGDHDLSRIESLIADKKEDASAYFREDLLFLGKHFSSKNEVLAFMHEQLLEKGLVDPDFLEAIHEREKVAPTAYGNLVAIPHPITPKSSDTFLAVCTLKKPVLWGDKPVQFVCILSVKKESKEDLQSMYELLGKIIENSSIVQSLLKATSCETFMDVLENI